MGGMYDLIVIGTGPAGEKAAVKAAYFGYKTAIVEKETLFGGAEVVSGTLPSKSLKETSLYFSGKYEKGIFGVDKNLLHKASLEDFMYRKNFVTTAVDEEIRLNLQRHGVDIYIGTASFKDPHTLTITSQSDTQKDIQGRFILIATGSYPYHPSQIPFDNKRVHDSDTILHITRIPSSLCIVGAGVIGCEYATIFSTIGTKVYLINDKATILSQLDQEVASDLVRQMHDDGVEILFNTTVDTITAPATDQDPVRIALHNGRLLETDMYLFAAGRSGNVKSLRANLIGLEVGKRDFIVVDKTYKTNIPHIYAAGDVIGFPALASTSMEQGRVAVAHMFQTQDLEHLPSCFPYGIYTIPEVSMVGKTEEEMQDAKIAYCCGRSRYTDLARGKIMGATSGFLKLIFQKEDLKICGVHVIGQLASEIIHFGVELVESGQTLYDVIGKVFNFPTLHDLYKYAAYDGLSNLSGHKIKP
ncbi:MAG: Si-specific NAD(P)(+) transhydrogenase [Chlamydiae bacterium]|nr:Si-specific NAD(P)(+) transhydrogenase [Chlamydiota bacterium]